MSADTEAREPEFPRGRAWIIRRDGEVVWQFCCPGCGLRGDIDDDQPGEIWCSAGHPAEEQPDLVKDNDWERRFGEPALPTLARRVVTLTKDLESSESENQRLREQLDVAEKREERIVLAANERFLTAEARVSALTEQLDAARQALTERAEHWEHDAEEAELAGNSYKGKDDDAAVELFREASRSRAKAREFRAALGVVAKTKLPSVDDHPGYDGDK